MQVSSDQGWRHTVSERGGKKDKDKDMIITYPSRRKNNLNHVRSEPFPRRIPMASSISGSFSLYMYQNVVSCMEYGSKSLGQAI